MSDGGSWFQPITSPELINKVVEEAKRVNADYDGDIIRYCGNSYYVRVYHNIVSCILNYYDE